MAEKLSITIALSGAEEIKRQLADVSQAGQDCFNEINKAAAEVGGFNKLDTTRLSEGLVNVGLAGKDVAKVLNAVKQAGRMETLVNGIAAVENGFAKAGAAVAEFGKTLGFVLPSVKTMARLLVLAFGAAVVGAIASTTKALLELDAAAIKAGISIGDMAKARAIFESIGIGAKAAATGVDAYLANQGKIKLEKVKAAAAVFDEHGTSTEVGVKAMRLLRSVINDAGEAGDIARKKLQEMGQVDISPAAREIEKIRDSAASAPDKLLAVLNLLNGLGNTAERNRLIFQEFGQEFGAVLVQMLNAGISMADIKRHLESMAVPTAEATATATRLSLAWEKLKTVIASPFSVSPEAMDSITQLLNKIAELGTAFSNSGFRANAQAEFQALLQIASQSIQGIGILLAGLGEIGFSAMKYIEAGAVAAWQTIIGWINKAIDAVKQYWRARGGQPTTAGVDAGGFARGGLMGGRGSGTSDSNLAWLSRGEHIMPASVVRQPGVMALLEALRRSGGNLRGVLDRMGHFALGGMVGAPSFAGGGINGMSHVTIQFPGLAPVTGLRASSVVVDELRRSAALAQVRSGGRKPSRYT